MTLGSYLGGWWLLAQPCMRITHYELELLNFQRGRARDQKKLKVHADDKYADSLHFQSTGQRRRLGRPRGATE